MLSLHGGGSPSAASSAGVRKVLWTARLMNVSLPHHNPSEPRLRLATLDGSLHGLDAILRFLARCRPDADLAGSSVRDAALVNQWLECSACELEPSLALPSALASVGQVAAALDAHLLRATYLVGSAITLADISLASVLHELAEGKRLELSRFPALQRWLTMCLHRFGLITAAPNTAATAAVGQKAAKKAPTQGKKAKKGKQGGKKASKPMDTEKLIKAALKEGGKKGQDIAGLAEMGGVSFFHLAMDSANGDMALLEKCLEGMNREVEEGAEDRKGGAGHLGKILFSYAGERLVFLCHLPEQQRAKADIKEWFQIVLDETGGTRTFERPTLMKGQAMADPDSGRFCIKMRDAAIEKGYAWLRSKMLVLEDDDSDDDVVYGDDDFPDYYGEAEAAPATPDPVPEPAPEAPKEAPEEAPVATPAAAEPAVKAPVKRKKSHKGAKKKSKKGKEKKSDKKRKDSKKKLHMHKKHDHKK